MSEPLTQQEPRKFSAEYIATWLPEDAADDDADEFELEMAAEAERANEEREVEQVARGGLG